MIYTLIDCGGRLDVFPSPCNNKERTRVINGRIELIQFVKKNPFSRMRRWCNSFSRSFSNLPHGTDPLHPRGHRGCTFFPLCRCPSFHCSVIRVTVDWVINSRPRFHYYKLFRRRFLRLFPSIGTSSSIPVQFYQHCKPDCLWVLQTMPFADELVVPGDYGRLCLRPTHQFTPHGMPCLFLLMASMVRSRHGRVQRLPSFTC